MMHPRVEKQTESSTLQFHALGLSKGDGSTAAESLTLRSQKLVQGRDPIIASDVVVSVHLLHAPLLLLLLLGD